MKKKPKSLDRNDSLDFCRGLAIIGVVLVHNSQKFPTGVNLLDNLFGLGRFGVQLFFIISSITMCMMWEHRKDEIPRIRNFLIRRASRIYPLFLFGILLYYFLGKGDNPSLVKLILASTLLQGIHAHEVNEVVPGGWSIAIEVMFYITFPVLICRLKFKILNLLTFSFVIWLITAVFREQFKKYLYPTLSGYELREALYMNFFNQLPVFIFGIICYSILFNRDKINRKHLYILFVWLSACIFQVLKNGELHFIFLPVFLSISVFLIFCIKFSLKNIIIQSLGKLSYGIYIFHFAILQLASNSIETQSNLMINILTFITVTMLSYFCAYISFRFFENPVQKKIRQLLIN